MEYETVDIQAQIEHIQFIDDRIDVLLSLGSDFTYLVFVYSEIKQKAENLLQEMYKFQKRWNQNDERNN